MNSDVYKLMKRPNKKGVFVYRKGKMIDLEDNKFKNFLTEQCADDLRMTMQLACGNCCKKVSNVDLFLFIGVIGKRNFDFAQLAIPPMGECLLVESFCDGQLVEKQLASLVSTQVNADRGMPITATNTKMGSNQLTCKQGLPCGDRLTSGIINTIFSKEHSCSTPKLPLFLQTIMNICAGQKLAVEFSCGGSLKKAINIECFEFNRKLNVVSFIPSKGECIVEKFFCGGKLVDTDIYTNISIPLANICSIECGAVELS